MELGPHAGFILGAYAVAVAIVVVLIGWVIVDYRRQRRILSDLEERGVSRRSEQASEVKK